MNNHHNHFHFLINRELNELYITKAIRFFAQGMINVFVPIFLIKLGYPLFTVLIFYAIQSGVHALFVIPAARIASRYGFKHTIFFSVPILIVFYLMLYTIDIYNWPLYLLAIIYGVNNALFWFGYHVDFCKFSDRDKRGEEVSIANIATSLFHAIGPAIGGLILTFLSFKALFVTVSALLLASTIPLFYSKDVHEPIIFSMKDIFKGQKLRNYLGFIGVGVENGAVVIWPIFIFFAILNNYTTLGLVSSLSLLFSLLFMFIAGKLSDINRRLVLKVGAIINSIVWGMRILVKTTLQVFIIDSFFGISKPLVKIPFDALSYDKASKENILRFTIFREIMINGSRAIFFIIIAPLSNLLFGISGGIAASILYFIF